MKKLFLLLTLLCGLFTYSQEVNPPEPNVNSTVVYNDSKDAVKTVYSDVKSLSPEIKSALNNLATKFNTTVERLWDILVRQQLVYSICFLLLTLSALINWWIFYRRNFNKLKEGEYIKGIKTNGTHIKNPNYYEYANKDSQRAVPFILQPESEEEILIPILSNNFKWFKYVHLLICITLSIFSFINFSDMMTGFVNPEYGALKDIVYVALKVK